MKTIIRGLFGERTKKYKEVKTSDYFSEDLIIRIMQLMYKFGIENNIFRTSGTRNLHSFRSELNCA